MALVKEIKMEIERNHKIKENSNMWQCVERINGIRWVLAQYGYVIFAQIEVHVH